MNKPRQLLPLLKLMLGSYRFGPLPFLVYLAACTVIVFVSLTTLPGEWMKAHASSHNWAESVFLSCVMLWCFMAMVSTPLPFLVLGGPVSLEFLFTRAIDRTFWLRAERLTVIILGLGPLILNLFLSPFGPDLAFDPDPMGSPSAAMQERYLRAFPGSGIEPKSINPEMYGKLVIAHGTEMLAAWMLWVGLVCMFLAAAYFTVAFTAWQRAGWHHSKSKWRPFLGVVMVSAPAYSVVLLVGLAALQVNPFEECFLLFAAHPWLMSAALIPLIWFVQRLSERNLKKLEFEFL